MARPLRTQWPDALYHATDRGNKRGAIFRDDADRARLLECCEQAADRFALRAHAVRLMSDHRHAEIEAPRDNLSAAMYWLNATYTMYPFASLRTGFNRGRGRSGRLFQGRYKSAVVEREGLLA